MPRHFRNALERERAVDEDCMDVGEVDNIYDPADKVVTAIEKKVEISKAFRQQKGNS